MTLTDNFQLLATSPAGAERLRDLILMLAMQGKLVPQCSTDEPAERLMKSIQAEKNASNDASKISKPSKAISEEETPFELPNGWTWVRLGDVCSYIQRGKGPKYAEQSDYPVVSQKCVRWYGLDLAQARFIEPESMEGYDPARILRPGDILWNSTGTGTIGRAVVVPSDLPFSKLVADSHVTVVRPVSVLPNFIWRWIQSPFVQAEIESMASGSTNQIELATGTVIAHLLPLPPLAEQARIVAKVNVLMHLCDELETRGQLEAKQHARLTTTLFDALARSESPHALAENWARVAAHFDLLLDRPEAVDALEQTILQLAVRGLLVKQEPNDEPAGELLKRIQVEKNRLIADHGLRTTAQLEVPEEEKYLGEVPGWQYCRLGNLARFIDYRGRTPQKVEAGIPLITAKNVRPGFISREPREYIAEKDYSAWMTRGFPRTGDLLFTTEAPLGNIALIDITERFALAQRVICFQLHDLSIGPYLRLAIMSAQVQEQLSAAASGMTATGIKASRLKEIPIAIPPLDEQRRIVARVEELQRVCFDLRERLIRRQLYQTRLAEALVGQAASTTPLLSPADDLAAAA
ncbi:restriction endonuclease subunit S [Caballeronia sp. SL2Y3]|uniref:restriction endonuclease subunit S n=1 Tax=Caballeronia sp. SL2Y3 TaxID=2878151 RepID=UPI001FD07A71|nr:restriction endonuclease subunit S [Caballeronia sp. SL2Y3]